MTMERTMLITIVMITIMSTNKNANNSNCIDEQ